MRAYKFDRKPLRLSKYLSEVFPELRYGYFRTLLKLREIRVNGKKISADIILQKGDLVEVYCDEDKLLKFNFESVYEDENVLVAVKPRGVSSEEFCNRISTTINKPTALAHRLDTNTKGLIMMSHNDKSADALREGFKKGFIEKKYFALVGGKLSEHLDLKAYLVKDAEKGVVTVTDIKVAGSVPIRTEVEPTEIGEDVTTVEVTLHSGKTHQIRAHLAYAGYPIVGDTKYGDFELNRVMRAKRQYLTACKLAFNFPKGSFLNYLNDKKFEVDKDF